MGYTKLTKDQLIYCVLTLLFIGGILLTVLEIELFRNTVINWTIPTLIWILTGILATPFTSSILTKYYDLKSIFWHVFYNICTFGGVAIYLFMAVNYYIPQTTSNWETFEVIDTGHLAKGRYGCNNPYVILNIYGTEKQLIFPCDSDVQNHKAIQIEIGKGMLGFYIIKEKRG